ncbi:hypothetical protein BSKO_13029 [Bryopsis sp. KO-2023]|nr:hypothetical protein BSKO_13029 [Bryopsis sp. KO-2023]
MAAFEELGVMPELIRAVEELGWMLPTPVQAESVPLILGGGDVMAAAETGSGKTGAFALPVLQIVHEALRMQAQGGGGGGGHAGKAKGPKVECKLNVEDRDSVFAISANGLQCQSRAERAWAGCRATVGAFAGKVYYEAKVEDEGLCRVGFSTLAGNLDLGTDNHSFGFGGTGKKSNNRQFESYGEPYAMGDVIGCILDIPGSTISFSKNGQALGPAFHIPQGLQGQAIYPAICLKNAEMSLNFGGDAFLFGPPQGFVGFSKAPANTVSSASAVASSDGGGGSSKDRKPLCIILEPARDLAEQTHVCIDSFKKYLASPSVTNALFVGGVDGAGQLRALREGLDIVTGTPGRISDFMKQRKLPVDRVQFFVLDEADRLLDTGNRDTILQMFRAFPKSGKGTSRLQVLMFSATLHSPEVQELAKQICQNPILVDLKGKDSVPETVDHVLVNIDPYQDKSWLQANPRVPTDNCHALERIGPEIQTKECYSEAIKRLKPRTLCKIIEKHKMEQCLIFCRTNFDCDNLEKFLNEMGGGRAFRGKVESGKENPFSCVVLAGGRSMGERRQALQAFKDGDVRFLICTDVAARGIDIKELPYVINMTLPDKSEDYIHRVGRVGRADTMGLAISFVSTVPEKVWYCSIKGYKPWFEPNQQNTKTNDQGGQTIWYDEPSLLKDIELRLGQPIDPMTANLSLPSAIAQGASKYGQQRSGGANKETSAHLQHLKQNIEDLSKLEWQAQTAFLTLPQKFIKQVEWPSLGSAK